MIVGTGAYVGGERIAQPTIAEIPALLQQPGVLVWLGLKTPSPQEFADVSQAFGLPSVCASQALDPHAHPAFTTFDTACSLIIRTALHNRSLERIFFGELTVFFESNFVITVRYGEASPMAQVRSRLEARPSLLALGTVGVLHAIVDQVIGDYIPVLHGLERDVVELERAVFTEGSQQSTRRIFDLKRQILDLFSLVDELTDPLNRIIRSREPWMSDAGRERMQDLDDQLNRLAARSRSLSDLLTSAMDAQLALLSVQQNTDMRRISAWAAILAVPTMVAGIYGMNFAHMPELQSRFGYPIALAVIASVSAMLWRWLRHNNWL